MRGTRPQFDFRLVHTDVRLPETLDEIRILFVVDGTCQLNHIVSIINSAGVDSLGSLPDTFDIFNHTTSLTGISSF